MEQLSRYGKMAAGSQTEESTMEIYIVRHGQTVWNESKRLQGRTDIELNAQGRQLAGETGEALESVEFDRIYSSPLIRAYETACLIRGHRNIPIIRDDRLKELCFGVKEGESATRLLADESDPFHYFFDHPELYRAPEQGESLEQICARAAFFMREVVEPQAGKLQRIMIVAHGALNKAIMCHVKQHGIDRYWSGGLQKNCGVTLVNLDADGYHLLEESRIFYEESKG